MKNLLLDEISYTLKTAPMYGVEEPTMNTGTKVTIIAAIALVVIGAAVAIAKVIKNRKK